MNRSLQWISILGCVLFVPCLAIGADETSRDSTANELPKPAVRNEIDRDPTAPSSRMLERIGAPFRNTNPPAPAENRPREITPAVTQVADIRIKAMVFSDDDNGSDYPNSKWTQRFIETNASESSTIC